MALSGANDSQKIWNRLIKEGLQSSAAWTHREPGGRKRIETEKSPEQL